MTIARKIFTGTIAALSIGASVALTAAPAEAKYGRKGAFFGGLAAGIIGSAIIASHAHGYHHGCWREKRPIYDRWGNFVGYRYIRACR